jgi:tetratricopeptide (TPR) repeat protein
LCVVFAPAELLAQKRKPAEVPITTSSKEALALFQQARDKWDNIEFAAAAALLDQAIQKDPNFAMAYAYRARSGGGVPLSRQSLGKALGLAEKVSTGEKHWILATEAFLDGNAAKAKQEIDELLKLYPQDARVHSLAGSYYGNMQSDLKTALEHHTKATAIDKTYAASYNQSGYLQFRLGQYGEAEQAFKQYIALRPTSPNPYDSYAELLMKTGRYDESIAQYQKALEKDPGFVSAHTGIGSNYVFRGDYAKARESYQRAFELSPNVDGKMGALFWRTVSYVHEGKVDEALKSLEDARTFAEKENRIPNAIGTHLQAAFILRETGQLAESVKHLEKASESLEKSSLPASVRDGLKLNILAGRASVLLAVHEFEAARAVAEKFRALAETRNNPNDERTLQTLLAQTALEEGKYDEALDHLQKADQENPYNWFHKAAALEKKGDGAAASELYGRIVGWNQNDLGYAIVRPRALKKTPGKS